MNFILFYCKDFIAGVQLKDMGGQLGKCYFNLNFLLLNFLSVVLIEMKEETLIKNDWILLVVMDRRLLSLQDKVSGDDKSCQHASQSLRKLNNLIRIL